MKKILLFLMLVFATQTYANDSTKLTVKEVYTDIKGGFKDAIEGLKAMASKLEGPAKHVYGVYINQHRGEGMMIVTSWIIFFVIPFIIFLAIVLNVKPLLDDDGESLTRRGLFSVIFGVISLLALIHTCITFQEGFQKTFNPEYYAIQDIIKAFK